MRKLQFAAIVLSFVAGFSFAEAHAQTASEESQQIAALFNKNKHKIKEKKGIRVETFFEVKNEPVVKSDAAAYSGRYGTDVGNWFELKVGAGGQIEASGTEPSPQGKRRFTLKDAKIEGALLTGNKIYEDGTSEKFEAAFINRTIRTGQNDPGTTVFGLGVRFDPPKIAADSDFSLNKLFYQQR
jgi:hypothetical protein